MSEFNQDDICYVIMLSPTKQDRRDNEENRIFQNQMKLRSEGAFRTFECCS